MNLRHILLVVVLCSTKGISVGASQARSTTANTPAITPFGYAILAALLANQTETSAQTQSEASTKKSASSQSKAEVHSSSFLHPLASMGTWVSSLFAEETGNSAQSTSNTSNASATSCASSKTITGPEPYNATTALHNALRKEHGKIVCDTIAKQAQVIQSLDILPPELIGIISGYSCYQFKGIVQQKVATHNAEVSSIALWPDGSKIALAATKTPGNSIVILDTKTWQFIKELKGHEREVTALTVLPNGTLVSGSADITTRFWNISTGKNKILRGSRTTKINAFTVLPNGTFASGDSYVQTWNSTSGACGSCFSGHRGSVTSLALLKDGRIASGSDDNTILILNTTTGDYSPPSLWGHTGTIRALVALPDGKLLASGSDDETIRIWDIESKKCIQILRGHSRQISALAVLSDGRLVSGSWDTTIKIWDTKTWKCVQTLTDDSWILTLTALPEDRLLSTSSNPKHSITIWA